MIKTTWAILNNELAVKTLHKIILGKNRKDEDVELDPATKYRVGIIKINFNIEGNRAHEAAHKLLKKYAKTDEKGDVLGYPDPKKIEFLTKEKELEHDGEFKKLLETRIKIPAKKIQVAELEPLELSVEELMSIRELVED